MSRWHWAARCGCCSDWHRHQCDCCSAEAQEGKTCDSRQTKDGRQTFEHKRKKRHSERCQDEVWAGSVCTPIKVLIAVVNVSDWVLIFVHGLTLVTVVVTSRNHNSREHVWWDKCFCVPLHLFNTHQIIEHKVTQSSHIVFPSAKPEESGGKYLMRADGILPFLMECDPQSLLASVNPATLRHSPSSVQR